jgi:hypothetical protein
LQERHKGSFLPLLLLLLQVLDSDQSMEVAGLAALSLGLVFTSSCKEDVVEALLTALMSRWARRQLDAFFNICMSCKQR